MDELQDQLQRALGDRYTVQRKLGAGGMATVFLATDVKHEREVAIKVLHPELAASIGSERFEREIRLAGKLQHPNILGMYDSGAAEGLLYYMMPFVEGESVADRLARNGQLPIDDAIQIALEVAGALGHAHAKGIVHRDIKPDNIMMSNGHALVADFGIARNADETAGKLTMTGMSLGTPVYMAPEQSAGEKVGPPADLYSLGCVLYEMLAGEPPFTGKNGAQIMAKHALEAVPSIRIVRPNVPEEVEQAIFAAMAKVPADRPQTAAEWMEILGVPMGQTSTRRAVMRVTSTHRAPTMQYEVPVETRPWWKRPAVLSGAAAGLALAAGGAWFAMSGSRANAAVADGGPAASSIAVMYFENSGGDSSLVPVADGLTEGLISTLGSVQGLSVISRGGVEPFRATTLPVDSVARALQSGTVVTGSLAQKGENLEVSVSMYDASGSRYGGGGFTLPASDLTKVRDSLAGEVARLIREHLGRELDVRSQRAQTSNPQAWTLLQRGLQVQRTGEQAARGGDLDGMDARFRHADSLFRSAAALDGKWADPIVARAALAYQRTRLIPRDPVRIKPWIDSGSTIADQALALSPGDADALEVRGNLRYWSWLVGLEPDPEKARALLLAAQKDFEDATAKNPRQAGAWASLSHLYYQTKSGVDVNLAAREALKADAFLANANVVLDRLFLSSYDLGQFSDAGRWCDESLRRFPTRFESARCRLQMLTTRNLSADVDRAWRLRDSMVALTPEARRPLQERHANMYVAAVIARAATEGKVAALADSARSVVKKSLGDAELDPSRDLALTAAFVHNLLGDATESINLLKIYLQANERRRQVFAEDAGWWFRSLQETPEFKRLVSTT